MVEQNDPNNIEAIFYSAYGKAKAHLINDDIYKRQAVFKVLTNCISIIDERYKLERREENKIAIQSIAKDLGSMICSEFVFTEWKNGYGVVTKTNKGETITLFGNLLDAFRDTIGNIQKVDDQLYLHESAIQLYKVAKSTGYWTNMDKWINNEKTKLKTCLARIMEEENEGKSIDELLELAYENLLNNKGFEAEIRFDAVIEKNPNEAIGYIGKSVAILSQESSYYDSIFSPILTAKSKSNSEEYREQVKKLVNFLPVKDSVSLLMHACLQKNLEIVNILIEMGADINLKSNKKVNALWCVCYKKLSPEEQENGRKIARILIDMGADVNVTNANGVALYNKDTDYQIKQMIKEKYPDIQMGSEPAKPSSSNGCYVATCVYGSYDCPQVWTLRRYRDYKLDATWYGRTFIKIYYFISPTIVKWFGDKKWFKKIWKGKLDKMVTRLNEQGYEDTEYNDKY